MRLSGRSLEADAADERHVDAEDVTCDERPME
jgi:hypothetical protein